MIFGKHSMRAVFGGFFLNVFDIEMESIYVRINVVGNK